MKTTSKVISILCVNDFHAEIAPSEDTLGSAKLVSVIKRYQSEHPNTIIVFGGDNYRGDPVSDYLSGEPVSQMMKNLGTVVSAVGNHEFDYERDYFDKWQGQGGYHFVAANVVERSTNEIPDFIKPYHMLCVDGVKIGIIGLATKEQLDKADRPHNIRSLEIVDGVESSIEWVKLLNDGYDHLGKPDVLIALTHYGLRYAVDGVTPIGDEAIKLCHQVPEFAGVFTAHWHQFMSLTINNVAVAQGGAYGKGFAVLTIHLTEDNQLVKVIPDFIDFLSVPTSEIQPDWETQQQIENYYSMAMNELGVVIGYANQEIVHRSADRNEVFPEGTPLTKLATNVMLEATRCSIALLYSGRMGKGFSKGAITLYTLYKILFFENGIVTVKLKGKDLIKNIETGICTLRVEGASPIAFAGINVTADYAKPFGNRIESISLSDGSPIEAERYYDIAMDEFIASGELGYDFSNGAEQTRTDSSVRNLMIESIQRQGFLDHEFPTNFILKNNKHIE